MDPRYSQAGGTNDPKLWGTPPSDMVDLEVVNKSTHGIIDLS